MCIIEGLELQPGAAGFQLSNPPMLETISLLASLNVSTRIIMWKFISFVLKIFQIFEQTTIKDLRKKSLLLTGYMELLLKQKFSQTLEGEQPDAKRLCIADRGLSLINYHLKQLVGPHISCCSISMFI